MTTSKKAVTRLEQSAQEAGREAFKAHSLVFLQRLSTAMIRVAERHITDKGSCDAFRCDVLDTLNEERGQLEAG